MSISAIAASYPPLIRQQPQPAISMPVAIAADGIPSVEIPAPPLDTASTNGFRSAKGEWRTDAAAPPTIAQASDGFSFADFIDVINPLQHIPGVNWAYQQLTGDTIKPAENIAGGILYGGVLGGMAAIAMSTISELWSGGATGVGDTSATTTVAQNEPAAGKFGGAAMPGVAT